MRELKSAADLRIVSVQVVNETPGSVRDVPLADVGKELRRMGGPRLAAALDGLPYLERDSKWELGKEWAYGKHVVECRVVQGGRYWAVKDCLHGSPTDAMERVDGTGPYAKRRGAR